MKTPNPFAEAVTVLSGPPAREWYKMQLGVLMARSWSGLQVLGLLVVNRFRAQLGRPPLPALRAVEPPELLQQAPGLDVGNTLVTLDVDGDIIDSTEEPKNHTDVSDISVPLEMFSDPIPGEDDLSASLPVTFTTSELQSLTVKELRSLARQQKLTFDCPISKTRKSQLVAALVGQELLYC